MTSLAGCFIAVTGASHGLGRAIASHLVDEGASLAICARTPPDLEKTAQELRERCRKDQHVLETVLDISQPGSVDAWIVRTLAAMPRIDALVNNAGVYGPMGRIEDVELDAWLEAVNINLMGTVYASRAVLPHFRKQGSGKIINLSGGGATQPLPGLSSYAVAKAGVVRFTETLACEVAGVGIDVNAIAPGVLDTRLLDELLAAGPERVGRALFERMASMKREGTTAPLKATAELVAFLASAASNGISGRLISTLWDPWRDLPEHLEELRDSDIYTLRRITPTDRGLDWGDG